MGIDHIPSSNTHMQETRGTEQLPSSHRVSPVFLIVGCFCCCTSCVVCCCKGGVRSDADEETGLGSAQGRSYGSTEPKGEATPMAPPDAATGSSQDQNV